MIYLCAGVYAEGRSDYAFLLPLVTRVLVEASDLIPQKTDVFEAVGIDAPRPYPTSRASRIAAAIGAFEGECTIFVVHADADRDAEAAVTERINPGRQAATTTAPIVACVPVREIEAWLLSDHGAFASLIPGAEPELPRDPEVVTDPKRRLSEIYDDLGLRGKPSYDFRFFGETVSLDRLRRLPAFRRFEDELRAAVQLLGHGGSGRERPP